MSSLLPQPPEPRVTNALDAYVERINGLRRFSEETVCRKCNGEQRAKARFCEGPPPGWRPQASSLGLPSAPSPTGAVRGPSKMDLQYAECVALAGVEHMHRTCTLCTAHWLESTPETIDQALAVTDAALALAADMAAVRAEVLRYRAIGLLAASGAVDSRGAR